MTTVIGSSTNLLAVDAFESQTGMKIDFFALAPIGLVLAAVGITFIMLSSKWLLPNREGETLKSSSAQGKQFIAQIELTRGHPMIGQGAIAGLFPDLPDMTVRMVQRKEEAFLPPFDDITFRLHDTIIVATTRKALTNLLRSKPDILAGVLSEVDIRDDTDASGELTIGRGDCRSRLTDHRSLNFANRLSLPNQFVRDCRHPAALEDDPCRYEFDQAGSWRCFVDPG